MYGQNNVTGTMEVVGGSTIALIQEVYKQREAVWDYQPAEKTTTLAKYDPKVVNRQPNPKPQPQPPKAGTKVKTIKHVLKDGTKLCPAFQKGSCPNGAKDCSKGKHLCGAVEKSGRICGGRHSPGLGKCTNKKVERV